MAIAFARVEIVSTKLGGSAVGLSAYLNRDRMCQDSTGRQFDFTAKAQDTSGEYVRSELLLSERTAENWTTSETLWNAAEQADLKKDGTIKKNAQLAKHMVLALPADRELTREQQIELAREFANEHFVKHDLAVEMVIHDKGDGNPHAHLLISTRTLGPEGFGSKARHLNPGFAKGKHVLSKDDWGRQWEAFQNGYFQARGLDLEVDAPGVTAQQHVGPVWHNKQEQVHTKALNNQIAEDNKECEPADILVQLTRNKSVFTERDISRAVLKFTDSPQANNALQEDLLEHPDLVKLYDPQTRKAAGYTTKQTFEQESRVMDLATKRHADTSHKTSSSAIRQALKTRTMDPEQEAAFRHALDSGGLKIIEGRAGAGKSYTMGAVREAYEASGFRVVGLSPTNTVAQDMKKDGFNEASTAHSAIWHQENNQRCKKWDRKTVILVDEAAMLDTQIMEKILIHADEARAKIILVGDDRQLASVARGGMFTEFKERFGSAEITTVRRQKSEWQKQASTDFSEGRFLDGLKLYQKHPGFMHWAADTQEQQQALIHEWTRDLGQDPARARFVYAGTNAEVNELNKQLRRILEERGEVTGNHTFDTCKGQQTFGVGDRIQFHGTDKKAGIFNGSLGTVKWVNGSKLYVLTDAGTELSFDARLFDKFALGYAGTVYRGQGKTQTTVYCLHGKLWESRTSYVGLTRHKERLKFFIDKSTTKDLRTLANQLGQKHTARASIGFQPESALMRQQTNTRSKTQTPSRSIDMDFSM